MSFEETLEILLRRIVREELAAQLGGKDAELLTADQAAKVLNFTDRRSVYKLKREGKLKAVSLGEKTLRFRREEVDRFIRERTA